MANRYKLAVIGSGKLASHLAPALENAGHAVTEVYSRNLKNAKALVSKLYSANATDKLDLSNSKATVFIIAVSDDAIDEVLDTLTLPSGAIVAHTSGTQSIELFGEYPDAGIFYPVQTFSAGRKIDWSTTPICLEATSGKTENVLSELAESISPHVAWVDSQQRKHLHLAAVLACNFTNHLLTKAKFYLEENELGFDLIQPLLIETLNKALSIGPENAQTGPATRGDHDTIEQHLHMLDDHPQLQEIYRVMTESIMNDD